MNRLTRTISMAINLGCRSSFVTPFSNYPTTKSKTTTLFSAPMSTNENDDTIITPRDPEIPFNFGPASTRDETLFTAERPGGDEDSSIALSKRDVTEWTDSMRRRGIENVLVLLDDNELEAYEDPGLFQMYKNAGFQVFHAPMGEVGAYQRSMSIVSKCQEDGIKIVTHCTHGQGRAGRVAAGWLATKYNLSPEKATEEVLDMARQKGVTRLGSPSKLKKWMENR
mmetsp:Transcript_1546/g.2358  ORF Transcript_1546/g.2358 Transcript_1546/m.2358 type:complete len:225 (+) Transcript_1546:164-838(+)